MKLRSFASLLLAVALMVVGCGSGDEGTPTTQASDQSSDVGGSDVEGGDDGDSTGGETSGGTPSGSDLPDSVVGDFPVDIPPGWEIDIHGAIGMSEATGAQLLYPEDASDGLIAFYDEWVDSQPNAYARTEAGDQVIYTGTETPVYWITITPNHIENDQTWTLLQVVTTEG